MNGTEEMIRLQENLPSLSPSDGRGAGGQAAAQLIATGVTLAISIGGGLVTGVY